MKLSLHDITTVLFSFSYLSSRPINAFVPSQAEKKCPHRHGAFSGSGERNSAAGTSTATGDRAANPSFPQPPSPTDGGLSFPTGNQPAGVEATETIWELGIPVTVQGRSLKTWAFPDFTIDKCQLVLKTDGRPLQANIDLWQGPRNTPHKISLYSEDGNVRPFSALMATPGTGSNVVRIVNTATLEFPLRACVVPSEDGGSLPDLQVEGPTNMIQGGSLRTYPFETDVQSVQVLIKTDGRPLNCRIELLQGPNTVKQVMEVYTEDGSGRPFYVVLETPGAGNVVRVVNSAPMEFPLTATVAPFAMDPGLASMGPAGGILGGNLPELSW